MCVEVRGDLDLIEKFAIEKDDDNGNVTLLDIEGNYQWMPLRCSKCSTFRLDYNRVIKPRLSHVIQSNKPTPYNHLASNPNKAKHGVWQVVSRKVKGKQTIDGSAIVSSSKNSPQRIEVMGRGRS